jgi:hypothetical protein
VGYATAAWAGFGGALAAIAGALTGLLFVAVSVKSEVLAASRSLSSRAAQTLVLFLISVLVALVLVAPRRSGKPGWRRGQRVAIPRQGDQLLAP